MDHFCHKLFYQKFMTKLRLLGRMPFLTRNTFSFPWIWLEISNLTILAGIYTETFTGFTANTIRSTCQEEKNETKQFKEFLDRGNSKQ